MGTKNIRIIVYTTLCIVVIIILATLLARPILNKITEYREGVLQQSEEKCARDDAPFWCNL